MRTAKVVIGWTAIAIVGAFGGAFAAGAIESKSQLHGSQALRTLQEENELQPLLGSRIDALAPYLRQGTARDTLVVYAGPCQSCTINFFDPFRMNPKAFDQILIVYESSIEQTEKAYKATKLPSSIQFVADPDGKIKDSLKSNFFPQHFLVRSDRTLIGFQHNREDIRGFIGLAYR